MNVADASSEEDTERKKQSTQRLLYNVPYLFSKVDDPNIFA